MIRFFYLLRSVLLIWLLLLTNPLRAEIQDVTSTAGHGISNIPLIDADQQQPLPEHLRRTLDKLAKASGFSCVFEQTIFYGDGSEQRYSGTLAIAKYGKFRWQYKQPYEQLYVSDGDGVWFYEPDLMQAQHSDSLDAIDPVAMRFLEGSLSTDDIHVLPDQGLPGLYHIQLSGGPELWVAVDEQGITKWLESKDTLGNRNRIALDKTKFHAPEGTVFRFTPPKGVDVIEFANE